MLGNKGIERNRNKKRKHNVKAQIKLHNTKISIKIKELHRKEKWK